MPVKKLLSLPDIAYAYAEHMITVTYYHVLLEEHEIVYSKGAPQNR